MMRRVLLSRVAIAVALAGVLALATWVITSPRRIGAPATVSETSRQLPFQLHRAPLELPQLSFEDAAGRRRTLANFRGRHVLLNVWATWCVPCREEMPALARLQQKLGGLRFEVIALSVDSGGVEAVKRFFAEHHVDSLAVYTDHSLQVNSALRVVGIPTSVLVDREGREIARHVGPAQWDSAQTVEELRRVIAQSGAT
jgi:thiol-disulfide isomerase/thioredoxin